MRSIVAILTFYGVASFLPVLLVPVTSRLNAPLDFSLRAGDWLDLSLTPWLGVGAFAALYVLIPQASDQGLIHRNLFRVVYFFFAVLYIEGHGMHLAADLINSRIDPSSSVRLIETINFLDETLSHFLWFGGAAGLAITTILYQKNLSSNVRLSNGQSAFLLVAGLAYGAGFSIFIIEGRAVSWALPLFGVALFLMVVALFRSNLEWRRLPTWVFFLPGFVGGLLVFLAWWIQFNGFPEPSSLLLI